MKHEEQTIYTESMRLCSLLDKCVPMMTKVNRIIHLTDCQKEAYCLPAEFAQAYESRIDKYELYQRLYAHYVNVLVRVRNIINNGILQSPNPRIEGLTVRKMTIDLTDCVGNLDEALCRWGSKIPRKGRIVADEDHDSYQEMKGVSALIKG
jgi:hypothetical protein